MKKILWVVMAFLLGTGSVKAAPVINTDYHSAIFAGGCFWCMESDFEKLDGVIGVESGYTGGNVQNPRYRQVSKGGTGHFEAVKVVYDPDKIKYAELLEYFWRNVDPLDGGGQFCDRGEQYKSAVFYEDESQKELIEKSKAEVEKLLGAKVATTVEAKTTFYLAEDYHQGYYKRNPIRYKYYRHGCGRDKRLRALWGKSAH